MHATTGVKLVVLSVILLVAHAALGQTRPADTSGVTDLVGEIMLNSPYLLEGSQRARLDELNRQFREADLQDKKAPSDAARARAVAKRAEVAAEVVTLLEGLSQVVRVSLRDQSVPLLLAPFRLPGDSGAMLLRIDSGQGETRYVAVRQDLSTIWTDPVELRIAPVGVTWAVIGLANVPDGRTTKQIDLLREGRDRLRLTVDVITPPKGRLRVRILSSESGQPTPAMVRLIWKTDGNPVVPSNAVEFGAQFDNQGTVSGRRFNSLPGRLGGDWWCVPGPLDMQVSPGDYQIAVHRGLEHLPVFETVTVRPGETANRVIRLQRWTDMGKLGWYCGDDHIHCRILSDDDAQRLMYWAQAEDVRLVNVVKMGDIYRTYFEQRGFGKEYRVTEGGYTLSPGQECPRTHRELGHTLAMNTTAMVRDTDRYFLYDWFFDTVHAQGGLTGYAHLHNDGFWVHCDASMSVPQGKVDFAEILQFNILGTPLYYAFLNLGCKLTASAGSDVPWGGTIGDVRVYSHVGDRPFSADAWFEGVRRGHTFVTNGPMLDLRVDEALPGDEIHLSGNRKLRVRARTWGHAERSPPAALEIVVHGEVVNQVKANDGQTDSLSLDFEIDAGHGFWLAARAESADGTKAHTTPIYVIREGLRFWKHEAAGRIIDQMLVYLGEVEQKVAAAEGLDESARRDNFNAWQLARQGPELLKRVAAAREHYAELSKTIEKERPLRSPSTAR